MGNDQKHRASSCMVIEPHNFKIFAIPPKWLSHPTISKYCYPCYGFLTPQFQNTSNPPHGFLTPQFQNISNPPHGIFLDW